MLSRARTVANWIIKIVAQALLHSFNIVTRGEKCKEIGELEIKAAEGGSEGERMSKHYNKHSINIRSDKRRVEYRENGKRGP